MMNVDYIKYANEHFPGIQYDSQPDLLERYGPTALIFPDHFYEVQGGVVVIYFQKNRSVGCTCTIIDVDEKHEEFSFRPYA